ncbi:protein kinase domain-containing protein [Streptomyces prunicolor]|uniref:serine/threonine-protein kinase n=1 Tax=Streptomyces prunicolor TaxID=67348 RepID=UPI0033D5E38C
MRQLDDTDPRTMGPFTLLGRLGTGGMGTVYLGRSAGGRTVAVKVVRADLAADDSFRKRFRREVEAAQQVSGAFTAPVVDADTQARVPWLATAFVPGVSLRDAVARHGPLPEAALRTLLSGIAEALVHVHAAGLVHRDLSPANVLLALDGPHVIDFGISRPAEEAAMTAAGAIVGSPPYLSPEQALGEPLTKASDVFSLASTIAYAALGTHLFGEGHPAAVAFRVASTRPDLSGVPEALRPLLESCLAQTPADRPEPAKLVASADVPERARESGSWLPEAVTADIVAVRRVLTELREREPDPEEPPAPSSPRRRAVLLGLAGTTLAGAAGASYALFGGEKVEAVKRPSAADVHEATVVWQENLDTACPQVLTGKDLVLGIGLRYVWALTGDGGRRKWTMDGVKPDTAMAQGTTPLTYGTLDGTRLYVGGMTSGPPVEGAVLAIDTASGKVLWKAVLDRPAGNASVARWWGVRDGAAYLSTVTTSGATSVVAFDLASRKVRWTYPVPENTTLTYATTPAGSTTSFVFGNLKELTALTADGKRAWTRMARFSLVATAGPHLVVGDVGSRLSALDPATGEPRWSKGGMLTGTLFGGGVVTDADGSTLYALRQDDEKALALSLLALDPATGRTRWAAPLPVDGKPSGTAGARLLYSDGNVYRMDGASVVWALSASNGKPRWKYTGLSSSSPMDLAWDAGNGRLCVTATKTGTIASLNANGA